MTSRAANWTNKSVRLLAGREDPVEAMGNVTRDVVVRAIDDGWAGPPFDPIELAERHGIRVEPSDDVREARLVPIGSSRFRIEFNPSRSRRRVRYSIAHEIAHTLFPDCADSIRNRATGSARGRGDDWQLEALCNVAAAEILMPAGTLPALDTNQVVLERILELGEKYDVSTEAMFIRFVQMSDVSCATFAASRAGAARAGRNPTYRVDYMIGSDAWPFPVRGCLMPEGDSIASHCTAVDFTWTGEETWRRPRKRLHVGCVAIPPYPGSGIPRVIGIAVPATGESKERARLQFVTGDATHPRGGGEKLVVHVVNDRTPNWGGRGFARELAREHPGVQESFRVWAGTRRANLSLGGVHFDRVGEEIHVASMVCQHGYGPSPRPRIRYAALRTTLRTVADYASEHRLSIHMPRIGTGAAGGSWEIIEELIRSAVVAAGVSVTIYDQPGSAWAPSAQGSFEFS